MGNHLFLFYIYFMKFLESFKTFFTGKQPAEFKGKSQTYRFDDIHDDGANRMGTCKECGKVVDITTHSEEQCLQNSEEDLETI